MQDARTTIDVAVVDDYEPTLETIIGSLKSLKCKVFPFTDPAECLSALMKNPVDILVTDVEMPGMDGITLMERVRAESPSTETIIVTGNADKERAIRALKMGAYDFFEKPVDAEEIRATIRRTMQYQAVIKERDAYAGQVFLLLGKEQEQWGVNAFVGKSKQMRDTVRQLAKLHRASGVNVLIRGESGTGKELVARATHYGSQRKGGPFVPVNCAAVPADLAESVLFGHVKGAFTGAVVDHPGAMVQANGGTLFLDEIGDMPHMMQAKLLRVIEDGLVMPVGGKKEIRVDVRIVAATNADLEQRLEDGGFRNDLFYRLAGYTLWLPPLRERREDIPLLARHFAEMISSQESVPCPSISEAAMDGLTRYNYPGNVRELRNVIGRAIVDCEGLEITPEHVRFTAQLLRHDTDRKQPPVAPATSGVGTDDIPLNLEAAESVLIQKALALSRGNMAAAARMLGISRQRLYRKVACAGIEM